MFDPRAIADPKIITALASPMRQELVDTLAAFGGAASVAQLADHLGHHADGMYYHLRVLLRAGVIESDGATNRNAQRFRLRGFAGAPLRLSYKTNTKRARTALARYIRGLTDVAERDFRAALKAPDICLSGPQRQLWAARNKGWLSQRDVAKINRLLERLCKLTSQPRGNGRNSLATFTFVLAPVDSKPRRR